MARSDRHAKQLIDEAFEFSRDSEFPLSSLIEHVARIARVRQDLRNLLWLEAELAGNIQDAIAGFEHSWSKEEMQVIASDVVMRWIDERAMEDRALMTSDEEPQILAVGVRRMEDEIASFASRAETIVFPENTPGPLYQRLFNETQTAKSQLWEAVHVRKRILARIRPRVVRFLSSTEQQVILGDYIAGRYDAARRDVELTLGERSPSALERFNAACQRAESGDREARAHALTSCRRLLKALADALYPPRDEPVLGVDGREHDVSDDKYINRLWQAVHEAAGDSSSASLLHVSLQRLGEQLDHIYRMSSKGVHADVSEFEMDQCIMQAYMLMSDVLYLTGSTRSSAR